jgi:hypothetical protein
MFPLEIQLDNKLFFQMNMQIIDGKQIHCIDFINIKRQKFITKKQSKKKLLKDLNEFAIITLLYASSIRI